MQKMDPDEVFPVAQRANVRIGRSPLDLEPRAPGGKLSGYSLSRLSLAPKGWAELMRGTVVLGCAALATKHHSYNQ
jgi:hypothetical protein